MQKKQIIIEKKGREKRTIIIVDNQAGLYHQAGRDIFKSKRKKKEKKKKYTVTCRYISVIIARMRRRVLRTVKLAAYANRKK